MLCLHQLVGKNFYQLTRFTILLSLPATALSCSYCLFEPGLGGKPSPVLYLMPLKLLLVITEITKANWQTGRFEIYF